MQLEHPLLTLVQHCETICVAGCCGRDAFDFSPIHIASYLLRYTGRIDDKEFSTLGHQLETLRINYGTSGASGRGVSIDVLNENLSGEGIDRFVATLLANLTEAHEIIAREERRNAV